MPDTNRDTLHSSQTPEQPTIKPSVPATAAATPAADARPVPQGQITAQRLQAIARIVGASRYLEIGVQKGLTFNAVDLPHKVAVDPQFRFDTAAHQRAGTAFHEITSDAFFRSGHGDSSHDLIFLDGLHSFAQTFRDFCATVATAHARTVWLIDDTVPEDAFSILPTDTRTFRLRDLHRLPSRSWHGDVFKVAFAIHDFFPTLDFRTVIDKGNPQTVVLRRTRPDFAPFWNDLEAISRLDFEAFNDNRARLKPVTEAEMLSWVAETHAA